MNTLKEAPDGRLIPGKRRCFYREGTEDQTTPALFQSWAMHSGAAWAEDLLACFGIAPTGSLNRVAWSYSWEQKLNKKERPRIADIVVGWEDDGGPAVLVIETKPPGKKARVRSQDKDHPASCLYLDLPSLRGWSERRHYGLLVPVESAKNVTEDVEGLAPVASWSEIVDRQLRSVDRLAVTDHVRQRIRVNLSVHALYLKVSSPLIQKYADFPTDVDISQNEIAMYEEIKDLTLPVGVKAFLLGSIVNRVARTGRMPFPPYEWLGEEPDYCHIARATDDEGRQRTADREQPIWRPSWKANA